MNVTFASQSRRYGFTAVSRKPRATNSLLDLNPEDQEGHDRHRHSKSRSCKSLEERMGTHLPACPADQEHKWRENEQAWPEKQRKDGNSSSHTNKVQTNLPISGDNERNPTRHNHSHYCRNQDRRSTWQIQTDKTKNHTCNAKDQRNKPLLSFTYVMVGQSPFTYSLQNKKEGGHRNPQDRSHPPEAGMQEIRGGDERNHEKSWHCDKQRI